MATRPSKRTIEPLLEEYAQLEARRIGIQLKRDIELAPLREAYERKAAPIVDAATAKLDPISKRLKVLAGQIDAELMAGVNVDAETVALSEVVVLVEAVKSVALSVAASNKAEAEALSINEAGKYVLRAIASVDAKPGSREIGAKQLFESVKPSERTDRFWSMFKVLMSEADKVLGKDRADALAGKRKTFSTSISLKP